MKGTPYQRLQHSMARFDRVAALSVEGVNKSSIARLEGLSWKTVARWLELAAAIARRFNAKHLREAPIRQLARMLTKAVPTGPCIISERDSLARTDLAVLMSPLDEG